MVLREISLSKLKKEELVRIALDPQQKQDLLLNQINQDQLVCTANMYTFFLLRH